MLVNDRDYTLPGSTFGIVEAGPAFAGGVVVVNPDGQTIVYTPPPGFIGDDHFRYIIRNAAGGESRARVTVRSVTPQQNGILRAADDVFTVAAGETAVLNVLANDGNTPSGGSGLVVAGVVGPSPAGLVLTNNSFTYDASYGMGPVTFEYAVSAGGSALGQARVTINMTDRRGSLDSPGRCLQRVGRKREQSASMFLPTTACPANRSRISAFARSWMSPRMERFKPTRPAPP